MSATVRFQKPYIDGNLRIYPVVTEVVEMFEGGVMTSVIPLALLIEDSGMLSCMLLEGDSLDACLGSLISTYT